MKKKQCQKCHELKEIVLYENPNRLVCRKCRREKLIKKMEKFESTNLGLEALDKQAKEILVIGKYFNFHEQISVDKAIELVEKGAAQVYQPETIYLIFDEDNQIVREEVLERDLYTCHYCGKYRDTVDHIVPRSQGGKYTHENLVCSCFDCNNLRLDMNYNEFIQKRDELIKERKYSSKIKQRNKKKGQQINDKRNQQNNKSKLDLMIDNALKPKRNWE